MSSPPARPVDSASEERRRRESDARNSAILATALDAIITMDHEGNTVEFNPAAERIFGYRRDAIIGQNLADFIIPEALRERHRQGIARYLATGEGKLLGERLELTGLHADGTEFPIELAINRIPIDGPPVFTAHLRDISGRIRDERHRNLRMAVVQVLTQAPTVSAAASDLLRAVCEGLGWDVGIFWTLEPGDDALHCLDTWHAPEVVTKHFEAASRKQTFRPGEGLPGRAWQSGEPIWLFDAVEATGFPRAASAAAEGLHAAFACPLVVGGATLGVIEFFSRDIREPDLGLLETMATVAGLIGHFVERKQAEAALRRSEARFRGLMEQAPVSIQIFAPDGRTIRVNRAWEELWGVTFDQMGGYNILEDRQLEEKGVLPLIRKGFAGETAHIPAIEYNPNDTIPDVTHHADPRRWLSAVIYPLGDADGQVSEVALVHEDITARFLAEQELRLRVDQLAEADRRREELLASLQESEEKLRLLADTIPQLAWMAEPDGHIFWFNRRWYEYTGTTPEMMDRAGYEAFQHPDVLPEVLERWQRSIASGEPFDMVFPLKGADQKFRPFLTRVNPLRDQRGRVLYWFGTNTDISEIKRMEEALRDTDRRKDEFLATLAHELRNPLAPIRNSLQILKMPRVDEAMARRARELMERQVQQLVRLVDDLLDVSRVMRGKIELRKEPVELASIVARAVETVQPLIEMREHELEVSLPAASMMLHADPIRLSQVVSNLLTNAAKYTDPGGHIAVSASRDGGETILRVCDDGIGIAEEALPHVFELFVQVDHATTRSQGGLGIGLTLVKNLVAMHGGSVEAESAGLGKGTEMVVRLPLSADARSEPTKVEAVIAQPTPTGHRLMVVDDNEDAALTLAMLLELQGHEVRVAHDGAAALETLKDFRPALIFLDIGMPKMDGYEVARRIRAMPGGESTVLAALTGWGQPRDRLRTAEAGFDHHLVKPPELAVIERLLDDLDPGRDHP